VAERILLIEDDPRLAAMVSDYLGEAGFRVTHAANGTRALRSTSAARSTPSSSI